MRVPVGFLVRRWWWRKWHPAVRVGWTVSRHNTSGSQTQAIVGVALIGIGLILRSRRSHLLYSASVDPGTTIAIRNATGGSATTVI